jgi:type IV pilus assembly protein PilB
MGRKRLGDVLRERKHITIEDLDKALAEQAATARLLGEVLLERNLVTKNDLVSALEEAAKFRYVDVRFTTVERAAVELIPRPIAERYSVLPLVREGKKLVVAMSEPQNLRTLDELRFLTGMEILPRLGFPTEIVQAIEKCYAEAEVDDKAEKQKLPFIEQVDTSEMQFFTASSSERNKAAMEEFEAELRNERTPAVRLVSSIIAAAAQKKASDIHIEPHAMGTVVRIRVDGVMRDLTNIPSEFSTSLVSRIKILSDMDISERRMPQDGRFLVQMGSSNLDLRVSTLPTHEGSEKVALRLLDPKASKVSFTGLGLSPENAARLNAKLTLPQGMILVTGPTGSGKSTTLYGCLNVLRSPAVHIITVEDPVEYKIEEINQIQVNAKQGLTFASCLRSILRQDPNIIMVGEIRDSETAEIALQASQTGHLVLSTLHTNDSIAAITRLLDLGIPNFLISASVTAVLAQRLVRKLCFCRKEAPITEEYSARLHAAGITDFGSTMYTPGGCARCDNTGYKGRVGIYELLIMDDQIRASMRTGFRDDEVRMIARSGGMKQMQEDALEKVKAGVTTLDEVLRVVPFEQASGLRCDHCHKTIATNFVFCPYCGTAAGIHPIPSPRKEFARSGGVS